MSDAPLTRRHSIRLKGFDYSRPGAYFVTICEQDRECLFWDMQVTEMGSCGHDSDVGGHCANVQIHFRNCRKQDYGVPDESVLATELLRTYNPQ